MRQPSSNAWPGVRLETLGPPWGIALLQQSETDIRMDHSYSPLWRPLGMVELPSGATKGGAKASYDLRDSGLGNEASELEAAPCASSE
jgi:hypothetical protein